jgi:hypothetical protein
LIHLLMFAEADRPARWAVFADAIAANAEQRANRLLVRDHRVEVTHLAFRFSPPGRNRLGLGAKPPLAFCGVVAS